MARTVLPNGTILPAEYSDDWYEDMTSNLNKLDDVIGSDSEKLNSNDVAFLRMSSAALTDGGTGNFSNLNSSNKLKTGDYVLDSGRKLYQIVSVDSTNETFTVGNSLFKITAESDLAPVAESGDYDDLNNKPDLKPVATSGDYDDLTDLPTYGITRFCSSAITDNSSVAFSAISSTNKINVDDFLLDTTGKMYQISSVDTANETVSVTTPLTQLAVDSSVMHLSGDETAAGIKTFSNDLIISLIKSVTNLTTGSSTGYNILPLVASITYTDGTATKTARLNFRIQSDGSIALYPNENGAYTLGIVSCNWDNVFSYMFESFGKNLGNEFSSNARTNLYLKANRDTSGQSGVYVSKFRQNRAQGEMGNLDVVQVTFDVLENSVRSNRLWYLNWLNWENDVPKTVEVRSLCEKVDYKLTHINDLNPGCLSLPDTSNAIDISGYITDLTGSRNTYTAPADGYVSILIRGTAMRIAVTNGVESSCQRSASGAVACYVPVVAGETVTVYAVGTSINNAMFRPCKGNV
ncbi:TPA: hypothetical protein ACXLHC_004941 [Klebsiella pneumoniae]